jgi:hypothetical protein
VLHGLQRKTERVSSLFLLSAAAYRFGEEEGAARLSELAGMIPPAELAKLEENASYHELEPLLHLVAGDCSRLGHPLNLPENLAARWSRVHERESARSAVIHHGAGMALAALVDAGVRTIPLKGYYLASRFYERKSSRPFRDLDLLVEEESLPALNRALLDTGFRPHPGRPSFVPAPAYTVYFLPVGESDAAMEIDIHVGMHWPEEYFLRTRFRSEDLWTEVSPEIVEGTPAWSLSPVHLVITTLLDVAVNHRYARLVKFRDLCEILRKVELDWEEMVSWCRRWEVRSFVGPGLRFLAELDPALMEPPPGPEPLLPSYPLMDLFLRAMPAAGIPDHRARSFSLPNLIFFLLADTGSERARGLLHLPRHILRGRHKF